MTAIRSVRRRDVVRILDSNASLSHRLSRRHWLQVGARVANAPLVLIVNSTSALGAPGRSEVRD